MNEDVSGADAEAPASGPTAPSSTASFGPHSRKQKKDSSSRHRFGTEDPAEGEGVVGRTVRCDDGVPLHVQVQACPASHVTVVFVHGIGSSLQEFAEQREDLAHDAHLVFFDQRGHGGSGCGEAFAVTVPRLARDLAIVINETTGPDERVILVTHSLGGMIALALIGEQPELVGPKIAGIALIATAAANIPEVAAPGPVAGILVRTRLAQALLRFMVWSAPVLDAVRPALTLPGRWWLRYTMFGRPSPPTGLLAAKQFSWSRTPAAVIASIYRSLLSFDRLAALEPLHRIPVLVVTGTDDRTIPAGRSRRLAALLGSTAELLVIQGAGHSVNQTHASAVNEALRLLLVRAS